LDNEICYLVPFVILGNHKDFFDVAFLCCGELLRLTAVVVVLGTIMMSGSGILTNGKGTRREYGDFNLDELQVCVITFVI